MEVKDIGGKRFLISKIAGSNQQISIAGTPELLDHFGLVSTFKPNPKDPSTTIDYPVTGTDAVIENFALYDIEGSSPIANPQTGLNYVSKGNQVTVIGVNGEEIKFSIPVTYDQAASAAADEPRFKYGDNTPATNSKDMFFEFKDYGPIKIQVGGSFNNSVSVYIPKLSAETLGLIEYRNGERYELLNYCTTHSASLAIDQCDDALSMVSDVRARLGALQNRLEATVRALDVASENTISSRSRIRDTDMAKEMTDYAAQDVMYQAGIAILTQANQRPMQILSLLNN